MGGQAVTSIAPAAPDILGSLARALRQSRHKIWNAQGVQVGSYETLDAACQGQWFKLTGVAQPPASQLYVMDFWGRKVPLSTQCTRSAVATAKGGTIVHPQPVTPAAAAKAVADANQAATGSPIAPPVNLDPFPAGSDVFPAPGLPGALGLDPVTLQRYAIYGGLGVLGLIILTSGSGRRR
jgi:hypothetical protein